MSETSCKRFAVCSLSSVGDRKYQEDKYSCHEQGKWRAWAVFDGHGGAFTSQWLSKHALESLLSAVSDHFSGSESIDAEKCMKTMCQTVKSWDEKLRNTVKDGSGSTVCIVCVYDNRHAFLINAGDSRALLVYSLTGLAYKTTDHTAKFALKHSNSYERDRIARAGGYIEEYERSGAYYVYVNDDPQQMGLMMTRSVGDFHWKQGNHAFSESKRKRESEDHIVACDPELTYVDLSEFNAVRKNTCASEGQPLVASQRLVSDPNTSQMKWWTVLATDGLWDHVSNESVCNIVRSHYKSDTKEKMCKSIYQTLLSKVSHDKDNITIVVAGIC